MLMLYVKKSEFGLLPQGFVVRIQEVVASAADLKSLTRA